MKWTKLNKKGQSSLKYDLGEHPSMKTKPTKSNNSTRTRHWVKAFLRSLTMEPNITVAANRAKIDRTTVYDYRNSSEEFAKAWDDALAQGADRLESEAFRRAVHGTLKPVYQQGMKVGTIREYSDTLTALLLKAHKPKQFRDNAAIEMSGPDGQAMSPVQIYLPQRDTLPEA